jgi:hypothetical protein
MPEDLQRPHANAVVSAPDSGEGVRGMGASSACGCSRTVVEA